MNPVHLGYVVHEITRNRLEEAARHRLAAAALADRDDPPIGPLRRGLARAAAGAKPASTRFTLCRDTGVGRGLAPRRATARATAWPQA